MSLLQYSCHSLFLLPGGAMSLLSILAELLEEVRNFQKSGTLEKFTSFTQLPFPEYWKWSSAQARGVLGARWLWMRGIVEKGITCRELHPQEMQECSYNPSETKAFLLLRPQFPQWREATVMPHLDRVCMTELGLIHTRIQEPWTETLIPCHNEKLLLELTLNFA